MCLKKFQSFLKKHNIDFMGISLACLCIGTMISLASLASTGMNKKFTPHKLDVAFKVSVWLQLVSVIIGSICSVIFLISPSFPPLEKALDKIGRILIAVTGFIVLHLDVAALAVYTITRKCLSKGKNPVELNDPDYELWNWLLKIAMMILGNSMMITMTPKREKVANKRYRELVSP